MPTEIPARLRELASEFYLDLSDFEKPGEPIDWREMIDWVRHWADVTRAEELDKIEELHDEISAELDELESALSKDVARDA